MKILLINASPHGAASHGFRFAGEIVTCCAHASRRARRRST
ncbi:NAD(P)H-dependent oxidoreductase [Burkholderia stagnalis]|nr:NAD(P)H-dependent oxidoreductase [Burkholderia stagnalis]